MVTVISRFRVRNGLEQEVCRAFLNRPRLVEKAAGFCGLDVLTDAANPSVFLLLTRWTDESSFQAWHRSEAHHQSHSMMPQGLKLDATFTSLTIGNRIEDPSGVQTLSDALEGRTVGLSRWLTDSDSVFALLLAPDGSIRARNKAGYRVFPPEPAKNFGLSMWDYLVCSDVQDLREQLAGLGTLQDDRLLLNVVNGQQDPVTLEVGLVRCSGAILLLGTQERRYDSQFETEILKLTNDLSLMTRESARKNRELQEANETIGRLARTDALTGLANRRTLDETFAREIARAERLRGDLSMIMGDLDHFKSINDQFGHIIGDHVLASAAAVFQSNRGPMTWRRGTAAKSLSWYFHELLRAVQSTSPSASGKKSRISQFPDVRSRLPLALALPVGWRAKRRRCLLLAPTRLSTALRMPVGTGSKPRRTSRYRTGKGVRKLCWNLHPTVSSSHRNSLL